MAKFNDSLKVSNEEIEAKVEEFTQKLETLRVRYEQYFIGTEKKAPVQLRMDVARLIRDLERANIRNTALKFKVTTCIQKFTSYSTYWNRVLREIEDGTYKRHLDRAKRNIATEPTAAKPQETKASSVKDDTPRSKATQEVADEAEAFLASLGLAPKQPQKPAPAPVQTPVQTPAPAQNIVRPTFIRPTAAPQPQDVITPSQCDTQPNPAIRQPSINAPAQQRVAQPAPAIRQPSINAPAQQRVAQPAPAMRQPSINAPAQQRVAQPAPAIRQPSISAPAQQRPAQPAPAIRQPSINAPAQQRPAQPAPAVRQPSITAPAQQRPAQPAPAVKPPNMPPVRIPPKPPYSE